MMHTRGVFSLAVLAASEHPIRNDIVERINSRNGGWTAALPEENPLSALSEDEIRGMMGLLNATVTRSSNSLGSKLHDIPTSFDGRSTFSSCQKSVRDQANCGSCWAFGAAETLTTNLCVLGVSSSVLSPQDLISCDSGNHGCNGGTLPGAWDFIDSNGLVSDSCMPYASAEGDEPACSPVCTGYGGEMTTSKCPVPSSFLTSDEAIQAAVMTVGAVEVGFTVYEDFMNYKSGVYKYTEGMALGGHAVKIVGWGQDYAAGFYWIVQNSWGSSFGENGFFKIVNWKVDHDSAIAIGGGFACVSGSQPSPPSPAPAPETCEDIVSYCSDYDHAGCAAATYVVPVCKKTCGCCDDFLAPSYCSETAVVV